MGLLDKLVGASTALPDSGTVWSVDVRGADETQVLGTLVTTFGSDDNCAEIELFDGATRIGSVRRDAAIGVLADGYKGIGSADGMLLPGVANYTTTTWTCALCDYRLVTIVLGDPPRCARHPAQLLEQEF